MSFEPYDLLVLGGGSGGYAAALRAAQLEMRVALVEAAELGGTCLHRGCIPTKAWLHAGEVADTARDGHNFGINSSVGSVDVMAVREYSDGVVNKLYGGLKGLISARGIEVHSGWGRLVLDGDTVAVDVKDAKGATDRLRARSIVLATGSTPRLLPAVPVDDSRIITSDGALQITELPATAIVLGGGVIGAEFASAWRSLGVEVHIVEALDRLVASEDAEASKALHRAFVKRGITVSCGVGVEAVETTAHGVRATLTNGTDLTADLLLVAVGRGPATTDLGFEGAGVTLERGYVTTDDRLATSVPGVYAVGDIVAGLQLAHRGFSQGIFVAEEIAHREGKLSRPPVTVGDEQIPRVTYSSPEIASVGLSEAEAKDAFDDVAVSRYDLGGNGRSQILKTSGFVKVIRRSNGPVLGVTMVGDGVSELIGEAQLITAWEAYPEDVAPLLHAHPTQNEALGEAHLALAGKPLHLHS